MLMNILASLVLFLLTGPFDLVNSWETEAADPFVLHLKSPQQVFVAVNEPLDIDCLIKGPNHDLHSSQLLWKHNNTWIPNASHVIDNRTVQLRIGHVHFNNSGVYGCGLFSNSSQFQNVTVQNVTVVVGEKPLRPKQLKCENVFGKPVQELTVWWTGPQVDVTYKLFIGRIPEGQLLCKLNYTMPLCTQTSRYKNELLSCHLGKEVLGWLFLWNELTHITHCSGGQYGLIWIRCDVFCAQVVAQNAFGPTYSEYVSKWNLLNKVRCPPVRNLNVSFGEQGMTVSWQGSPLVWEQYKSSVVYYVAYNITSVVTGTISHVTSLSNGNKVNFTIQEAELWPFTRYQFALTCCLSSVCGKSEHGPAVYTQVTSPEEAPSGAPSCQVHNRTSDGDAFVILKPPPMSTWNGRPRKYIVYYDNGQQQKVVNTSLDGLDGHSPVGEWSWSNGEESTGVWIHDLDPHMNYSVRVAMCTGGGCGENKSRPCFINAAEVTEDTSAKVDAGSGKPAGHTGVVTWIAIASGLTFGLTLFAFIAYSIKRKRSRRTERPRLQDIIPGLNDFRNYENDVDDGPSFCEESRHYERIPSTPLLKDMDCTVGNLSVSKL